MNIFRTIPVFIPCLALLLISCGKEPKKVESQPFVVVDSAMMPMEIPLADSTIHDTVLQNNVTGAAASALQATDESYDDGYLDGEAMAEEDRLAGRPGMQVGLNDDDEDDDDYEDGFDDGYED